MSIEFHHTELLQLKQEHAVTFCRIVMIDGDKLCAKCNENLRECCDAKFKTRYFKGLASIETMDEEDGCFNYTLSIKEIYFKPGIFVNERV